MDGGRLLARARAEAGLTQEALADAAATSRTALSAYEQGRKSPTLDTMLRLVAAAGFELALTPKVDFVQVVDRGRPIHVPTELPRLALSDALATVELPLHLNWSERGRRYALADRAQRARVYEIVLREGRPSDVLTYVDGALLIDLWEELVLPQPIREAWNQMVLRRLNLEVA